MGRRFRAWILTSSPVRRYALAILGLLLIASAGVATGFAYLQRQSRTPTIDFGEQSFQGIVTAHPCAMICVPGVTPTDPPRMIVLADGGQPGVTPRVQQLVANQPTGVPARVSGNLQQRDGRFVLELQDGEKGLRILTPDEQVQVRTDVAPLQASVSAHSPHAIKPLGNKPIPAEPQQNQPQVQTSVPGPTAQPYAE